VPDLKGNGFKSAELTRLFQSPGCPSALLFFVPLTDQVKQHSFCFEASRTASAAHSLVAGTFRTEVAESLKGGSA